MFVVYDNGKPAIFIDESSLWNENFFKTFEEAEEYALNWLGDFSPGKGVLK